MDAEEQIEPRQRGKMGFKPQLQEVMWPLRALVSPCVTWEHW